MTEEEPHAKDGKDEKGLAGGGERTAGRGGTGATREEVSRLRAILLILGVRHFFFDGFDLIALADTRRLADARPG